MTRISAILFLSIVAYWLFFHADSNWVDLMNYAGMLAIVFLSITVITGFAGQVSLCQATFATIGASATSQLAIAQGVSILVAMLIGALIAAVVGVLIAIPSMRLGGIFLALATLSFAYFFDQVILQARMGERRHEPRRYAAATARDRSTSATTRHSSCWC